jgi:hypothetical protein
VKDLGTSGVELPGSIYFICSLLNFAFSVTQTT